MRHTRRSLLGSSIAGAGLAALAPVSALAADRRPALQVLDVADGLVVIAGGGCNVVATGGKDGLLLVDGGLAKQAERVLEAAGHRFGTRHVHTLFNTHWHPEQTGANQLVAGRRGRPPRIIAHENTRLWLGTRITTPWDQRSYAPLPGRAQPNDTIYTAGQTDWQGQRVDYGQLFQAHTDGDIYVFFRGANVLAAGGVVSAAGWPLVDWWTGGWIVGLVNGLKTLLELADADTRIVPANGPLLRRAHLEKQHEMYSRIAARLQQLLRQGRGIDEMLASAPAKEYEAEWGDPRFFLTMAFRSLWGQLTPDA